MEDLKGLTQEIVNAENFHKLRKRLIKAHYKFGLDYFRKYDDSVSNHFVEATDRGNKKFYEILNDSRTQIDFGVSNNVTEGLFLLKKYNKELTLLAFSEMFSVSTGIPERDIFESYNGGSSIYIEALSEYSSGRMYKNESASKNDVFDLHHLTYLPNRGNVAIVTNDKLFKKLEMRCGALNVLAIDDFKKQVL